MRCAGVGPMAVGVREYCSGRPGKTLKVEVDKAVGIRMVSMTDVSPGGSIGLKEAK